MKSKTKKNIKITAGVIVAFGILLTPPLIIASKNETLQKENQKLKKELEDQKEKRETQLDELEIKIDEIDKELDNDWDIDIESLTPEQIAKAFVSVIGSDQEAYQIYEEAYKAERKRLDDED